MTQEVQPLTWSKRTNIEEHQQFFSKINEIIGNLAPTVDEAEQAIAQATAAIASANDAVATANTASAAASAAASQAQTAASTVAGYDGRLTAVEGDIDAAEGDITALQGRMTAAESKNSQQDTAITELQTADRQNVKINSINQYAVGLTGNQDNIAGKKVFLNECTGTAYFGLTNKRAPFTINDRSTKNRSWFRLLEDVNGITLVRGFYDINENGTNQFSVNMDVDVGGTTKTIEVIGVATDASGVVTRVSVGGRSIA